MGMRSKNGVTMTVDIDEIADTLPIKVTEGWVFITHDGQMVGPEADRDTLVAKAALYLASQRQH